MYNKEQLDIYTVSEVTTYIKIILEKDHKLNNILVRGEISNFIHHSSGHMYFTLKDEHSVLNCVMFERANKLIKFKLENGIKVILKGNIEVYKPKGTYQLIVEEVHLEGTGDLYLKFIELKEKLKKQGLFLEKYKKEIPKYPKFIGIITSLSGAVLRDIINVIKRRYPYLSLIVAPTIVQGDNAAISIKQSIEILNKIKHLDVIIIARGGGSLEELWPFNEEIVARAVFNSRIPIISAVGHETDRTITDFVADKYAPTPSAAAELVVPNKEDILSEIQIYKRQIFQNLVTYINQHKQFIDEQSIFLNKNTFNKLILCKKDLKYLKGKLNTLNPKAVLKRGYGIVMKNNKIIKTIGELTLKDLINIIIRDGTIESEIKKLKK